jgi:hypothetical protein
MMLFLLIAAHGLCDYSLQGDTMSINKNPNAKTELQKHVPWYFWLGSHAFIHGGAVALITNNPFLGLLEIVCHFLIDFLKCNKKINIYVDQLLHIACKFAWLAFTFLV